MAEDQANYESAAFDPPPGAGLAELTEEERSTFQDVYGESIQVSSDDGELYELYEYHDSRAMKEYLAQRVLRHIDASGLERRRLRILEVGCADGFLLRELQRHVESCEVLGIEPSPVSCEQARTEGTPVINGTLESANLSDEAPFDVAIALGNLMLHPDPVSSLREMRSALGPAGIVIIDVKNAGCSARKLAVVLARLNLDRVPQVKSFVARNFTNFRYAFDRNTVQELVRAAGLEAVELSSEPPRAVRLANNHFQSNGIVGRVWRLFDGFDKRTDNRAWLEIRARKSAPT